MGPLYYAFEPTIFEGGVPFFKSTESIGKSSFACLTTCPLSGGFVLCPLSKIPLKLLLLTNTLLFPEQDVVRQIEKTETADRDRPVKDVSIKDCGVLPVDEPFHVDKE